MNKRKIDEENNQNKIIKLDNVNEDKKEEKENTETEKINDEEVTFYKKFTIPDS
jgi:hypothetical protein